MTINYVDSSETSVVTTIPTTSTSLPAILLIDVPPLSLEAVAGDEIVGPETGSWSALVPIEFRPCESPAPEHDVDVSVWTLMRHGEPIGYLVGASTGGPAHLTKWAYAACRGGSSDITRQPQVRSWWTDCQAGVRVIGRWRSSLVVDDAVVVASVRSSC